jgi:putative ABC transport system permease protein
VSKLLVKSLRDLRARRWQTLGIALLVAVIVTAVAGSIRGGRTLAHTRAVWYEELNLADLEIRCSPTGPGILDRVRGLPGVAAAEERMLLPAVFRAKGTEPLPAVVRVLPASPPEVNRLALLEGRYPETGEEGVVLDRSLRQVFGLGVGDRVEVEIGEERAELPVLGISASPDHILTPCHPVFRLPLSGAFAVLGISTAAAGRFAYADRVDSLLFRFEEGHDAAALQSRLQAELPVVVLEILPRHAAPAHRASDMIIGIFDVYLPVALVILVGVALTLLVLTLHRTVHGQESQIGLLLSLGHRPAAVAATYLPMAVLPAFVGSVLGASAHGWYARFVSGSYTGSIGFAPLHDAGPGPELVVASCTCVVLSALAALGPALATVSKRPLRLLRPAPTRAVRGAALMHAVARLKDALRLPLSVVVGLSYLWRRRWTSLATVLCLGLAFAVVIAFSCLHVTHSEQTSEAMRRFGLDVSVRFAEPVTEETVAEVAETVGGRVEPRIVNLAVLEFPAGPTQYPIVCLPPDGWFADLPVERGRLFTDAQAEEMVIDQWVADVHGLEVGDRILCFPGFNAPEGVALDVVGVMGGASLGRVFVPLDVGREIFGLTGLATGVDVASDLPQEALVAALREMPNARSVMSFERAREKTGAMFAGLERVLVAMVLLSILIAVIFLALLAALDSADRAPDLAVLGAIGWRDRSTLAIIATEVMARGGLAFLVSIPTAPLFGWWLLDRIRRINHYHMELTLPGWVYLLVGLAGLVVVPLGALPAWRLARRVSPARAVRVLATE